jgi:hypothetical protein
MVLNYYHGYFIIIFNLSGIRKIKVCVVCTSVKQSHMQRTAAIQCKTYIALYFKLLFIVYQYVSIEI